MWFIYLSLSGALAVDLELDAHPIDSHVLTYDDVAAMPPPANSFYGVVDVENVVVVRPQGDALQQGFEYVAFSDSIKSALDGRSTTYDFAMVIHTDRLPTQFSGAAAFHLGFNNDELSGTGGYKTINPDIPVKSGLWMSSIDFWDRMGLYYSQWVFGQELGHYWLAFPEFDKGQGEGEQRDLLGRAGSHWSYFMDTTNSPVEGNKWMDNGDGSFTTDIDATPSFSELDLYMMGLIEADDVSPFFYIDVEDNAGKSKSSSPQHLYGSTPETVTGTKVMVTVDDVIAAEGDRYPTVGDSPSDFKILTVLVLAPTEMLTDEILSGAALRQQEWAEAWSDLTLGLSSVDFTVVDEGRSMPPLSTEPQLIPRGAW